MDALVSRLGKKLPKNDATITRKKTTQPLNEININDKMYIGLVDVYEAKVNQVSNLNFMSLDALYTLLYSKNELF